MAVPRKIEEIKKPVEAPSEAENTAKEAEAMKNVPIWFKGPEAIAKSIKDPVEQYKALQKGESYSRHLGENIASQEDWKKSEEGQEWATAIEAIKKDEKVQKYIADEEKKSKEALKKIHDELERKKAERDAGIDQARRKAENAFIRAGGEESRGAGGQGTHVYSAKEMKKNIEEQSSKKAS
jgi:hypothetical protein